MNALRSLVCAAVAAAATGLCASSADAGFIYNFEGLTNNNAGDVAIGEAQFLLEVSDAGSGIASFLITNSGPEASSIARVYFDGDSIGSFDSIINGPGVAFSIGGSPTNLPGGNMIGFSSDLHATADEPPPMNGINPGEMLTLNVMYSGSFAALIDSLNSGVTRVGIHAIAFDSGGSESFVTIPAPGALALLAIGMIASPRRRRN